MFLRLETGLKETKKQIEICIEYTNIPITEKIPKNMSTSTFSKVNNIIIKVDHIQIQ